MPTVFCGKGACSCGEHDSRADHDVAAAGSAEARLSRVVESAVVRALFPEDRTRRSVLQAVGASTALAAIAQFFPLGTAIEAFAQAAAPEKRDLKVGFIPISIRLLAHVEPAMVLDIDGVLRTPPTRVPCRKASVPTQMTQSARCSR
jgi:hypothetical protein